MLPSAIATKHIFGCRQDLRKQFQIEVQHRFSPSFELLNRYSIIRKKVPYAAHVSRRSAITKIMFSSLEEDKWRGDCYNLK